MAQNAEPQKVTTIEEEISVEQKQSLQAYLDEIAYKTVKAVIEAGWMPNAKNFIEPTGPKWIEDSAEDDAEGTIGIDTELIAWDEDTNPATIVNKPSLQMAEKTQCRWSIVALNLVMAVNYAYMAEVDKNDDKHKAALVKLRQETDWDKAREALSKLIDDGDSSKLKLLFDGEQRAMAREAIRARSKNPFPPQAQAYQEHRQGRSRPRTPSPSPPLTERAGSMTSSAEAENMEKLRDKLRTQLDFAGENAFKWVSKEIENLDFNKEEPHMMVEDYVLAMDRAHKTLNNNAIYMTITTMRRTTSGMAAEALENALTVHDTSDWGTLALGFVKEYNKLRKTKNRTAFAKHLEYKPAEGVLNAIVGEARMKYKDIPDLRTREDLTCRDVIKALSANTDMARSMTHWPAAVEFDVAMLYEAASKTDNYLRKMRSVSFKKSDFEPKKTTTKGYEGRTRGVHRGPETSTPRVGATAPRLRTGMSPIYGGSRKTYKKEEHPEKLRAHAEKDSEEESDEELRVLHSPANFTNDSTDPYVDEPDSDDDRTFIVSAMKFDKNDFELEDTEEETDEMQRHKADMSESAGKIERNRADDIIKKIKRKHEIPSEEWHRRTLNGTRPIVEVRFGNTYVHALLDTGASSTAMNKTTFDYIIKKNPNFEVIKKETTITGMDGHKLKSLEVANMTLTIGPNEYKMRTTCLPTDDPLIVIGTKIAQHVFATMPRYALAELAVGTPWLTDVVDQEDLKRRLHMLQNHDTRVLLRNVDVIKQIKNPDPFVLVMKDTGMERALAMRPEVDKMHTKPYTFKPLNFDLPSNKTGDEHEDKTAGWGERMGAPTKQGYETDIKMRGRIIRSRFKDTLLELTPRGQANILSLLVEYQDCFSLSHDEIGECKHVEHDIKLVDGAVPSKEYPRRIAEAKKIKLKQQLDILVKNGVIFPAQSPWCSPLVLVDKPNGDIRICCDFRKLNLVTVKDSYPPPRIDDLLDTIGKSTSKFFTKLDMRSGFWMVKMSNESAHKTTFATPWGTYSWACMPFGLANAPPTFQRMVDNVFSSMSKEKVLVYLDDLLMLAKDEEELVDNMHGVLQCMRDAGIKASIDKTEIAKTSMSFLGFKIDCKGITPDPNKLEKINNLPEPKSITQLRRFVGTCNYYRKFVDDFSKKAEPLFELLRGDNTTT